MLKNDNHRRLLTLSKNGDVYTSIRISLTLGCYMNFHIFPMDIQTCPIELESFGYSMDILRIVQILKHSLCYIDYYSLRIIYNNLCTDLKIQVARKWCIATEPIYCSPSVRDKGIQTQGLHQALHIRKVLRTFCCTKKTNVSNLNQENLHVYLVNL